MDHRKVTIDLATNCKATARSILSRDTLRLALWSIATTVAGIDRESYSVWAAREPSSHSSLDVNVRRLLAGENGAPIVTLIIAYQSDQSELLDTVTSVTKQASLGIEIVIPSPSAHVSSLSKLTERFNSNCRVTIVKYDGSLAEAEAHAVSVAQGQFVAFLSEGDNLADDALSCILLQLAADPKLDMIYSDEDWIDAGGKRLLPRFKARWDYYAQLGFDLPGRLCIMRRSQVEEIGGLRSQYEPAHHYDLHLRLGEHIRSPRISHIPHILYHRRVPGDVADGAAIDEALETYSRAARVVAGLATRAPVAPSPLASFVNKIAFPVSEPLPLVTVIVPTRDKADLLRACAQGVLTNTNYSNIELLILDNDSRESETDKLFAFLSRDSRVRIVRISGPFNYSRINNMGAKEARGDVLLFLNNDVEVISPGWLTEMVRLVMLPDVACVGAKLLYVDRTIQHAGIVLDKGPLAMHVFRREPLDALGYEAQLAGVRSYSAVTAACLAIRSEVFAHVGGFDESCLQVAYNDVDLCLKAEELGYVNLCTPFEPLFHLEGASRAADISLEKQAQDKREQLCLFSRWPDRFLGDPSGHPNVQWSWDVPIRLVATGEK